MGQKGWLAPGEGKHAQGAGLIQNGPRTAALASDPRDTTRVAVCESTGWGGGSPAAPASIEGTATSSSSQASQGRQPLRASFSAAAAGPRLSSYLLSP